jgi:hypothetical protein
MKDFRVRWVKPGQELRRDEVQPPGIAALKEPRSERPVVPGRIEPSHARRQLRPDLDTELDQRKSSNRERNQDRRISASTLRPKTPALRGVRPSSPHQQPYPQADRDDGSEIRRRLKQAEAADDLRNPDEQSEGDHRSRKMRRGSRERG